MHGFKFCLAAFLAFFGSQPLYAESLCPGTIPIDEPIVDDAFSSVPMQVAKSVADAKEVGAGTEFPYWVKAGYAQNQELREFLIDVLDVSEDAQFELRSKGPLASYDARTGTSGKVVVLVQNITRYWCMPHAVVAKIDDNYVGATLSPEVDCLGGVPSILVGPRATTIAFVSSVQFDYSARGELGYEKRVTLATVNLDGAQGVPFQTRRFQTCDLVLNGRPRIDVEWQNSAGGSKIVLSSIKAAMSRRGTLDAIAAATLATDRLQDLGFGPAQLGGVLESGAQIGGWLQIRDQTESGLESLTTYSPTPAEEATVEAWRRLGPEGNESDQTAVYLRIDTSLARLICAIQLPEMFRGDDITANGECGEILRGSAEDGSAPAKFILHIRSAAAATSSN